MTSRFPRVLLTATVAALLAAAGAPLAFAGEEPPFFIIPAGPVKNTSPDAPKWYSDVRDAFAQAKKSELPVAVDFFADWCGWCKVMEAKVFSTPEFAKWAKDYVLLRVDVEDNGNGTELAARYSAESLPTMLLLESSGALIGEIRGYQPVADFLAQAKAARAVHDKSLETYEKLVKSSDAESLRKVASDLYARRDGPRAAVLFARLIEVEPSSGEDALWLRFFLADSLRRAERFEEASAALGTQLPAGVVVEDKELAERLALLPFWIARDAARCSDATEALADFERDHPGSIFLPGARHALADLRAGAGTCS